MQHWCNIKEQWKRGTVCRVGLLYKQNVIYAGIQIMPLSLTDKFLGCMIYDLSILFLYISLNKFNDTVLYVSATFTSAEYRVWKYILWTFVIGIRKNAIIKTWKTWKNAIIIPIYKKNSLLFKKIFPDKDIYSDIYSDICSCIL